MEDGVLRGANFVRELCQNVLAHLLHDPEAGQLRLAQAGERDLRRDRADLHAEEQASHARTKHCVGLLGGVRCASRRERTLGDGNQLGEDVERAFRAQLFAGLKDDVLHAAADNAVVDEEPVGHGALGVLARCHHLVITGAGVGHALGWGVGGERNGGAGLIRGCRLPAG